jgi:hypothetical protein
VPAPGQRVRLIVGSREFAPASVSSTGLTFAVAKLEPGDHVIRLRVDGVDSLRVVRGAGGLEFEPTPSLKVTP